MNFKKIKNMKYLIFIFLLLILFSISFFINNYNMAIIIIMLFWCFSIIYFIKNIEKCFYVLIFFFTFFTFILSRPFIGFLKKNEWWYFSKSSNWLALSTIFVSLVVLFLGTVFSLNKQNIKSNLLLKYSKKFKINLKKYLSKKIKFRINKNIFYKKFKISNTKKFNNIIFIIVIITFLFNFSVQLINYFNLKDLNYSAIYSANNYEIPLILKIISSLFNYFALIYLALFSEKKRSFITLLLLIIVTIPNLILGSRNSFVLQVLFTIVYYFLIKLKNNEKIVFSIRKIVFLSLVFIISITFLGLINYSRDGKKITISEICYLPIDFFYLQGTTYDTISQGYEYKEQLSNEENVISYTFGDIIDYIKFNTISQKIFSTPSLESGNSINKIKYGNSMAHHLSYYVLGEGTYLAGNGRGTSYIIENYIDGGFLLLILYNFVIAILLSNIVNLINKNNIFINILILNVLSNIFLLPRYSATGFIQFLVLPYFWLTIFIFFGINYFLIRRNKNEK